MKLRSIIGTTLLAAVISMAVWEVVPETRVLAPVDTPISHARALESDAPLTLAGKIRDLYVSYVANDGTVYGFSDHFLFVSEDGGENFHRRGSLPKVNAGPKEALLNWIARSKLVRSLRDSTFPGNMVVLDTGTILVFYDRIYRSTDGGWSFSAVHDFYVHEFDDHKAVGEPFGGNAGIAVTDNGGVYFGEYLATARPNTISIVGSVDDGRTWSTKHRFAPGEIFHVHSVAYDPYRDRLWVFTGDRDHESHIFFTDDEFETLETIGGGAQMWRAVSGMPTAHGLTWGSDDDVNGGSIYRWDAETNRVEEIQKLPGVVYYSARLAPYGMVMSTTHEPNSRFTQSFHPPAETQVWISDDGYQWSTLLHLESLFDPEIESHNAVRASVAFSAGARSEQLFAYPFFTKPFRPGTLVFSKGETMQ